MALQVRVFRTVTTEECPWLDAPVLTDTYLWAVFNPFRPPEFCEIADNYDGDGSFRFPVSALAIQGGAP